jgi:hypothetical protein
MQVIELIKKLNNPRFGSFGEYIFEYQNSTKNIERKHSESTDFILNGKSIDVKSTRCFKESRVVPKKYRGKNLKNIEYAYLQFYSNVVICSIEHHVLFTLDYSSVENIFKKWELKKKSKLLATKKISSLYHENLNKIKKLISAFYIKQGLDPRIIYRTNQSEFGKESPGNLIYRIKNNKSVTVFIDFKSHEISENNINQIIAFRDQESDNFPFLKNPKLHEPKVDLEFLDKKYKFDSLKDLMQSKE